MRLSLAQLQSNARQAGFPESQIVKAAAIAKYESNGDPLIINSGIKGYNPEYSIGLYQINTLAHHGYTIEQLQNPLTNAQIALGLLQNRPNWGDWYLSNGKYNRDYLGIASQSRAIYDSGDNALSTVDTISVDATGEDESDNTALYILLGLGALILLS